jgi:site-specific recombinase XerC
MSSLANRILPKRLRDELERVLLANVARRANGKGVCSTKTQLERRQTVALAFGQLWEMGYRIASVASLGERHVKALVERWDAEGLVANTLHTRVSILKAFCAWIGKRGLVQDIDAYLPKERIARHVATTENKAWHAREVVPETVIADARARDPRFAICLELQYQLGLRVKESIEFKPAQALLPDGQTLEIYEGTKGGRIRRIALNTPEKRAAFEQARDIAALSKTGRVRWPGMTWLKARRHFYHLCECQGITRARLGVTAHGLRHGSAQREYRQITGLATPVEGGAIGQIDAAQHQLANTHVARHLGHGRKQIAGTYYGSYGHQLRTTQRGEGTEPATPGDNP